MQIKKYQDHALAFIRRLDDVRFVGQAVFVVVVILISWSGIKSIQTNYGLQKQISQLDQQNELEQLQNENLKLENDYFNSSQYLELSARQNFGLAAPGEKEIVVPEQVALAYSSDLPKPSPDDGHVKPPGYQRNFTSWVDFFLHRQNDSN